MGKYKVVIKPDGRIEGSGVLSPQELKEVAEKLSKEGKTAGEAFANEALRQAAERGRERPA